MLLIVKLGRPILIFEHPTPRPQHDIPSPAAANGPYPLSNFLKEYLPLAVRKMRSSETTKINNQALSIPSPDNSDV